MSSCSGLQGTSIMCGLEHKYAILQLNAQANVSLYKKRREETIVLEMPI